MKIQNSYLTFYNVKFRKTLIKNKMWTLNNSNEVEKQRTNIPYNLGKKFELKKLC